MDGVGTFVFAAERRRGQRLAVVEPEPEWLAAKGRKEGRKKGRGGERWGVVFFAMEWGAREWGRRIVHRRDWNAAGMVFEVGCEGGAVCAVRAVDVVRGS